MELIKSWGGVVALVILAIMGISYLLKSQPEVSVGASLDCGGNTCLQGGFDLTTGPFQNDGLTTLVGTTTLSAGLTMTDPTFGITVFPTSTATRVCITVAATSTASGASGTGLITVPIYGACN